MQGGSGLSLDELVKFDWEVALGDQTLSAKELMALARLKTAAGAGARPVGAAGRRGDQGGRRSPGSGGARQATVREVVRMALGGGDDRLTFEGVPRDGLDRRSARPA